MRPSRKLLRLLTALSFAGGVALLALGAQVSLRAHLGASAAALSSLGALVALLSALGFLGAGHDKSRLLMLFFFLSFLLVASLFVACYAAFFFHDALETWLKHHWAASVLRHLRALEDCAGFETCAAYLERRVAQLGAVGAALVALALAQMYCVVRIVTVPIVMKSMLSFVSAVFVALGAGLFAYGLTVKVHTDMTSGQEWIALILIVVGTVLVALSVLGVIGSRAKSRTLLLIYLVGISGCFVALLVCAVSAFSMSDRLAATYESQWTSSSLSCEIGLSGCSNCSSVDVEPCAGVTTDMNGNWVSCTSGSDNSDSSGSGSSGTGGGNSTCWLGMTVLNDEEDQGYEPNDVAECKQCPEWSAADVGAYLRSTLHILGLLAVLVALFIVVGAAGALVLRRSLAGYQTDSI